MGLSGQLFRCLKKGNHLILVQKFWASFAMPKPNTNYIPTTIIVVLYYILIK